MPDYTWPKTLEPSQQLSIQILRGPDGYSINWFVYDVNGCKDRGQTRQTCKLASAIVADIGTIVVCALSDHVREQLAPLQQIDNSLRNQPLGDGPVDLPFSLGPGPDGVG